jgi:SAM-dependent methyltransferase
MTNQERKVWRNAPTLYFARRLEQLAIHPIAVLDMGCGAGETLEQLAGYGYELYGYDLLGRESRYEDARRRRLSSVFGDTLHDRIRVTDSERDIPFDDGMFDVVIANQVFEHVRFLDAMLGEVARVLKPGGSLFAAFPLATVPMEAHLLVPFAHWLPPGGVRLAYLDWCSRLGVLRPTGGMPTTARQNALAWDRYLRENTYYRFMNEITRVGESHFDSVGVDTRHLLDAKADLLLEQRRASRRAVGRAIKALDRGGVVSSAVTTLKNAAFWMRGPRKPEGRA